MLTVMKVPAIASAISKHSNEIWHFTNEAVIKGRFFNKLPPHLFNVTDYVVLNDPLDLPELRADLPAFLTLDSKDISIVRVPKKQYGCLHKDPHRLFAVDIAISPCAEKARHIMYSDLNVDNDKWIAAATFDRKQLLAYTADQWHRIDNTTNELELFYLSFSFDKRPSLELLI